MQKLILNFFLNHKKLLDSYCFLVCAWNLSDDINLPDKHLNQWEIALESVSVTDSPYRKFIQTALFWCQWFFLLSHMSAWASNISIIDIGMNTSKVYVFKRCLIKGWVTHQFWYPMRHNDACKWGKIPNDTFRFRETINSDICSQVLLPTPTSKIK